MWCREREEEEERAVEAGAVEARDPEVAKLLEGRERDTAREREWGESGPRGRGQRACVHTRTQSAHTRTQSSKHLHTEHTPTPSTPQRGRGA